MNIATVVILLITLLLMILVVYNIVKKGMPCSCGSNNCKNCGFKCNKSKIEE